MDERKKYVTPINTNEWKPAISLVQGVMTLGSEVTQGTPRANFEGEVLLYMCLSSDGL